MYGVIKGFNGDKAPGPDGFSMAFFQSCWSILKIEIMEDFHNFHTQAVFEKSLNASFLALIPKKAYTVEVKDFRPISLVRGIYKIISKVLHFNQVHACALYLGSKRHLRLSVPHAFTNTT